MSRWTVTDVVLGGATQAAGLALDALPAVSPHCCRHVDCELQAGRVAWTERKKNKSMFDISFGRCAVEGRVEAVPVAHQNSFKFPSHFYTSYRLQVTFVVYIITGLFVRLFVSSFKVLKLTYLCSSFYTYASTTPQPSL